MSGADENVSNDKPGLRLTMVVTLRNGTQIRAGITDAEIKSNREGSLLGLKWTQDDDPLGSSIGYLDMGEVVAVHYERSARVPDALLTQS